MFLTPAGTDKKTTWGTAAFLGVFTFLHSTVHSKVQIYVWKAPFEVLRGGWIFPPIPQALECTTFPKTRSALSCINTQLQPNVDKNKRRHVVYSDGLPTSSKFSSLQVDFYIVMKWGRTSTFINLKTNALLRKIVVFKMLEVHPNFGAFETFSHFWGNTRHWILSRNLNEWYEVNMLSHSTHRTDCWRLHLCHSVDKDAGE